VSSDVIQAAAWGFVAASALPLGAIVAMRTTLSTRTVGAIMAFGAGTLISAVTFELVEQAFDRADLWPVVAGLGLGAVVFTAGDAALVRAGGRRHRDGTGGDAGGDAGDDGGLTIALGAVLDGVPESLVLGISLASGGAISTTFLIAVFISNLPESLASTRGMLDAGQRRGRVLLLWVVVALVSAVVAAMGATLDGLDQAIVALVQSFAAGALLALIADSLLPEAYRDTGLRTGLFVVLGFALAFGLTAFD
jgi:ZIP family zinc transporter